MSKTLVADLIGAPFADGGRGPTAYDCYGLAIEVFSRFGVELPDYNIAAFNCRRIDKVIARESISTWQRLDKPEVPCLVVIKNHQVYNNHVGVYLGNGSFIHTLEGVNCVFGDIAGAEWRRRLRGFYRYDG